MKNFKIILLSLVLAMSVVAVQAQENTAKFFANGISIELGVGVADYQGDIDKEDGYSPLQDASLSGSLTLRKKFEPWFDMGVQYVRSNLNGTREYVNPATGSIDATFYESLESDLTQLLIESLH